MKKIIITYTDEQGEAEDRLLSLTKEDRSKMIRRLIAQECAKHNITFPDNMPRPSRKRNPQ
jgi:hypothetical protein